jgi:hypothetical protein
MILETGRDCFRELMPNIAFKPAEAWEQGPTLGKSPTSGVEASSCKAVGRYLKTITPRRRIMSVGTIVLIIVVLLLIGAIPAWPYSRSWGYGPSGGLGLVLLVVLVLLLLGHI